MKRLIFALMFLGVMFATGGSVFAQGSNPSLSEAVEAYDSERFGEAAVIYEKLIESQPYSSDLYYNLGNSYFRDQEIGLAILAYEKSLLLNPRHQDAIHNIEYANTLLDTKMEDKRNWYIKTGEKVLNYATFTEILGLTLLVLALFLVSLISFLRNGTADFWSFRRKFLVSLLTILILLVGAKYYQVEKRLPAIVLTAEVDVRYGPSIKDQVVLKLGEGLKVFVTDSREHWSRVILVNGQTGWLQNHDIGEVRI